MRLAHQCSLGGVGAVVLRVNSASAMGTVLSLALQAAAVLLFGEAAADILLLSRAGLGARIAVAQSALLVRCCKSVIASSTWVLVQSELCGVGQGCEDEEGLHFS